MKNAYGDDYADDDSSGERINTFHNPGGNSALGVGARTEPCPTCGGKNKLTKADIRKGYQCDFCADMAEGAF